MLNCFPKIFSKKVIWLYLVALLVVSLAFLNYSMKALFVVSGVLSVVLFFHFSNTLPKKWARMSDQSAGKKIFVTALIIRVFWVIISCIMFWYLHDDLFDFEAMDSKTYHDCAVLGHQLMKNREYFANIRNLGIGGELSDAGYVTYLSFIYYLTNDSIIFVRLLKAVWGAWTCLLIYKIANRNFGAATGRLAGIMCMIAPNLVYYCGLHLKEVEMVFLATLFVERADYLLRKKQIKATETVITVLIGVLTFFFRTALGAVLCLSFLMAVVFTNSRIVGPAKNPAICKNHRQETYHGISGGYGSWCRCW